MPSGEVLVAAALAGMIYFAGVGIVHGVVKVGHKIGCAFHHCQPVDPPQPKTT